jgi:REP element-mobilizing transposase RayT
VTFLITFACYGNHLHGSENGSVDPAHNSHGTPILEANPARVTSEIDRMDQLPYTLDQPSREAVLAAIQNECAYRGWTLLAAHVRTNHVHAVVDAETTPERIMTTFKSYASRRLNQMGLDQPGRKRWARHGSTRYLFKPQHVSAAIQYVVAEQGEVMSVFESSEP